MTPYLQRHINTNCGHGHFMVLPANLGITFAFSFVANPFKRIVSYAAYKGIINGQQTVRFSHGQELENFRKWLAHPNTSLARDFPYSQAMMFAHYPMRFIGCTTNLAEDLATVLNVLGYDVGQVNFSTWHCASSCPGTGGVVKGVGAHTSMPHTDWYDAAAAAIVGKQFWQDFRLFNFSTSPTEMNSGMCTGYSAR